MQEPDAIKEYLRVVCEQIRWKKAHGVLSKEIENHILDQRDSFIHSGLDEKTATEKAIAEMGDPVITGTELDRAHRPKIEWSLVILTAVALLINCVIRLLIAEDSANVFSILFKSVSFTSVGIACMALVYWLDFTFIGKYPMLIYLGIIIGAFFIGAISLPVNGIRTYLCFILLLLPTVFAGVVYKMRTKGYLGIIISGAFIVLGLLIAMYSRNITSIIPFLTICFLLLTFAIIKGWFNVNKLTSLAIVYTPAVLAVLATFSAGYRRERLRAIISPLTNPEGSYYVSSVVSKIINSAKFIGVGEMGTTYANTLPSRDTDYLLTYLIHRFGWISFILIVAVLLAFITRAFILCTKQKSVLGRLIALSSLATFTMQVLIYIAANLGFLAISPLALPLISYSGTAIAVNMTLIGLILSVFTSGNLLRDNLDSSKMKKSKFLEFVDGKIIIDFGLK